MAHQKPNRGGCLMFYLRERVLFGERRWRWFGSTMMAALLLFACGEAGAQDQPAPTQPSPGPAPPNPNLPPVTVVKPVKRQSTAKPGGNRPNRRTDRASASKGGDRATATTATAFHAIWDGASRARHTRPELECDCHKLNAIGPSATRNAGDGRGRRSTDDARSGLSDHQ
jgi:hypothetical protein